MTTKKTTLMTPMEIMTDLQPFFSELAYLKRSFRKQGYSRILAISRLFPKGIDTLYAIKVCEHKNAVLILFIDPKGEGYAPRFTPAVLGNRAQP